MAAITIENKGFNVVSKSTDKILHVDGYEVGELFFGLVSVRALTGERCELLKSKGIPIEDGRVDWVWAVKQLVEEEKWYKYLTVTE